MFNDEKVTLGTANIIDLRGQSFEFAEATVKNVPMFDARNFKHCKYLNLKGSMFNIIEI